MYPTDDILIARGKYSTLGRERREQLERAQKVCTTIMNNTQQIMRDCEAKNGPTNGEPLETILKCHANLVKARDRLVEIHAERESLKPLAWDGTDE